MLSRYRSTPISFETRVAMGRAEVLAGSVDASRSMRTVVATTYWPRQLYTWCRLFLGGRRPPKSEGFAPVAGFRLLDFRLLRHPKNSVGIRSGCREKYRMKTVRLRLPTKSPKVNRSGEYRPGENGFRLYRHGRSGEPPRYNPRKQREISAARTSGERVCREVGGATGTGVEYSLGRKPLILRWTGSRTTLQRRLGVCGVALASASGFRVEPTADEGVRLQALRQPCFGS